jgi:RNA polymerase sigma factor (sigma-70 family)
MRHRLNHPRLTAEQEIELARRVHGSDPADAKAARDELVLHNFGLVGHIVGNIVKHWPRLDYDDLFSEAMVALVQVAERYDPDTHHTRFSTYAVPDIKGRLRNYVKTARPPSWPIVEDRPDPAPPVLERIVTTEELSAAVAALNELAPLRAYVIARRYGVGEPQVSTLREIARDLDCSYEYIRKVEIRALDQLAYRSRSANRGHMRKISI